jgi:hypothetical protein
MSGRPSPARSLPAVRRGYEFSRLQAQLLALAYEHVLPILRPSRQAATAAPHPPRPKAVTAALS